MNERNPFRCYDSRFMVECVLAALAVVVLALVAHGHPPRSGMRFGAAALQSLAFGWIVARSVLAVRKLDELQRHIHLVAIAIAFTVTGIVVIGFGFFEQAGLPQPPLGVELWLLMVLVWWISVIVLNRRYR